MSPLSFFSFQKYDIHCWNMPSWLVDETVVEFKSYDLVLYNFYYMMKIVWQKLRTAFSHYLLSIMMMLVLQLLWFFSLKILIIINNVWWYDININVIYFIFLYFIKQVFHVYYYWFFLIWISLKNINDVKVWKVLRVLLLPRQLFKHCTKKYVFFRIFFKGCIFINFFFSAGVVTLTINQLGF